MLHTLFSVTGKNCSVSHGKANHALKTQKLKEEGPIEAALQNKSNRSCREARPRWPSLNCILSTGTSLISRPHGQIIPVIWIEAHSPCFAKGTV